MIFFLSYNVTCIFPFQIFNDFNYITLSCSSYFSICNFVYFPYSTHPSFHFLLCFFFVVLLFGSCKSPGLCTVGHGRKGCHSQNFTYKFSVNFASINGSQISEIFQPLLILQDISFFPWGRLNFLIIWLNLKNYLKFRKSNFWEILEESPKYT